MTFQNLINFIFPSGPPVGKRFIAKSSLNLDGNTFLPEQIIEEIFFDNHAEIWIDIEKTEIDYNNLFDETD